MSEIGSLLGFRAQIDGFGDMAVCALTLPKARYQVWRGAQDAGYTSVTFGAIHISRHREYDQWASRQDRPLVIDPFYTGNI